MLMMSKLSHKINDIFTFIFLLLKSPYLIFILIARCVTGTFFFFLVISFAYNFFLSLPLSFGMCSFILFINMFWYHRLRLNSAGSSENPQFASRRCIIILILLFGFCMYQFYSASIVGSLLMEKPKTIKTLRNLIDSPLKLGIEDILYNRDFFKVSTCVEVRSDSAKHTHINTAPHFYTQTHQNTHFYSRDQTNLAQFPLSQMKSTTAKKRKGEKEREQRRKKIFWGAT